MLELKSLSEKQLDAMREVGNVGAGHAATALSQLINKKVMITVPEIRILPLGETSTLVGNPDTLVAGVSIFVLGDISARILLLLPRSSAILLSEMLLKQPQGSTKVLSELGHSAIKETGNILASAYLSALSEFLGLLLIPSVPSLVFDIAGAILGSAAEGLGQLSDDVLCVTTEFVEDSQIIRGYFLLMPDRPSLQVMLDSIRL